MEGRKYIIYYIVTTENLAFAIYSIFCEGEKDIRVRHV